MGSGGENPRVTKVSAKRPRLHGKEAITSLNDEVSRKTLTALAHIKETGGPIPLTFAASSRPMSMGGMYSGVPVYHQRYKIPTAIASALAAYLLVTGAGAIGTLGTVVGCAVMFLWYDFYSGILHVVLDEPANIDLPLIGQPALEFQWHHLIPSDIVRKDFLDAIGDLNTVSTILGVIQSYVSCDFGNDKTATMLMACKLFMAYVGQYSHREAHNVRAGPVSRFLQRQGAIISIKDHKAHHKAPYDTDFCLIGIMNPVIMCMREITVDRWAWLFMFVFLSIFDIKMLTLALRALLPYLP